MTLTELFLLEKAVGPIWEQLVFKLWRGKTKGVEVVGGQEAGDIVEQLSRQRDEACVLHRGHVAVEKTNRREKRGCWKCFTGTTGLALTIISEG